MLFADYFCLTNKSFINKIIWKIRVIFFMCIFKKIRVNPKIYLDAWNI